MIKRNQKKINNQRISHIDMLRNLKKKYSKNNFQFKKVILKTSSMHNFRKILNIYIYKNDAKLFKGNDKMEQPWIAAYFLKVNFK